MMTTARDLKPGDLVVDNFTPWAVVVAVEPVSNGVRVEWLLANGQWPVETYQPSDEFTRLPYSDPWGPGGRFIDSGLERDPDA